MHGIQAREGHAGAVGLSGCRAGFGMADLVRFHGLRKVRAALEARFLAGLVRYVGLWSYRFQDRQRAMPEDRTWTP